MQFDGSQELAVSRPTAKSTLSVRVRGLLTAAACFAVLAVGAWLQPRGSGFGTHTQLGLPTCSMLVTTGYPCPGCGLTTSVSMTMHGRLGEAVNAQPFGVILALALAALGVTGLAEVVTGRSQFARLGVSWWWLAWAGGAMLAGWGIKLALGVSSGVLPIR